jgi:ParB family chromosome partitioning protein
VLGGIDLDPASCAEANETVKAAGHFAQADDGLSREWQGTVWLNPPYGPLAGRFVAKLLEEHHAARVPAAILLLSAHATDTSWFQPLFEYTLCFTDHRIDFYGPMGGGNSTHGSVFVYVGPEWERFAERFAAFGAVVLGTNHLVRARSCIAAGDYYSRLGREVAA